jgi:hypothetical protein
LLAERGWIKKHIRGWLLTARGKSVGGEQHFSEQSGIPYVTWPETILENNLFLHAVAQIRGASFQSSSRALSGHQTHSALELIIANWLYIAGINHAQRYLLAAADETVTVDFFLPEIQVCLDIWGSADNAAALSEKLIKQDFYKKFGYDYIEIHDENTTQLDEILAKQLFNVGLAVY